MLPALRGCKVPLIVNNGLSEPHVLPLLLGEAQRRTDWDVDGCR